MAKKNKSKMKNKNKYSLENQKSSVSNKVSDKVELFALEHDGTLMGYRFSHNDIVYDFEASEVDLDFSELNLVKVPLFLDEGLLKTAEEIETGVLANNLKDHNYAKELLVIFKNSFK